MRFLSSISSLDETHQVKASDLREMRVFASIPTVLCKHDCFLEIITDHKEVPGKSDPPSEPESLWERFQPCSGGSTLKSVLADASADMRI